jgi:hypothetical protein
MNTRRVSAMVFLLALVVVSGCAKSEPPPAERAASASPPPTIEPPAANTSAAPTPAALPPANPKAIATSDGETSGMRIDVTELRRTSGDTLNLKMTFVNGSSADHEFSYSYGADNVSAADFNSIGGVHLIDQVGKKK